MDTKTQRQKLRASGRMALAGVTCALASATLFVTAIFPQFFDYLAPAAAGVLLLVLVFEYDAQTAYLAFGATSALAFFIVPSKEPTLLFFTFFGHYPILHTYLRKKNIAKPLRWGLGFLLFDFCMLISYLAIFYLLGWSSFAETFGAGFWVIFILGNATYLVYAIFLDNLIILYERMLHPKVVKIFKIKI